MADDAEITAKIPRAGRGGVVPPVEYQFKPGNQLSKGVTRGKGGGIIAELRKLLREPIEGDAKGRKGRQLAAQALLKHLLGGNGTAIREVLARIEGPIPTVLEGGDKPIQTEDVTDLSAYTADELATIRAIHEAANARRREDGAGDP